MYVVTSRCLPLIVISILLILPLFKEVASCQELLPQTDSFASATNFHLNIFQMIIGNDRQILSFSSVKISVLLYRY